MTREALRAEIAAMRARVAPPGITPREQVAELSGLEFLQGILAGRLPPVPIGVTTNFFPHSVEPGKVVFVGEATEAFYNPLGTVHGGWVSTLLDSCMACAVQTTVPKGFIYTSAELKVNFVRAITVDTGPVRAEGRLIHPGRQIATAEGSLTDADGRLLAHGTTTCFIFPVR